MGLKYDCEFVEEEREWPAFAGGESFGGGGGGAADFSSVDRSSFRAVSSTYFSKSVRVSGTAFLGIELCMGFTPGCARTGSATDIGVDVCGLALRSGVLTVNGPVVALGMRSSGPSAMASADPGSSFCASVISWKISWWGSSR